VKTLRGNVGKRDANSKILMGNDGEEQKRRHEDRKRVEIEASWRNGASRMIIAVGVREKSDRAT
jgi:hypothetical protein